MGFRTHEGLLVNRSAVKGFTNQSWPAPFGRRTHLPVLIDSDLLGWLEVCAAAGTWHGVFGIEPHKLVEASGGVVADLKRS